MEKEVFQARINNFNELITKNQALIANCTTPDAVQYYTVNILVPMLGVLKVQNEYIISLLENQKNEH